MNMIDKNLLHASEIVDTLFSPVNRGMLRKRFLLIDYKENGVDAHVSAAAYQPKGMSDCVMIRNLVSEYADQGKIICSIVELDQDGNPLKQLYLAPGYLKECVQEILSEV